MNIRHQIHPSPVLTRIPVSPRSGAALSCGEIEKRSSPKARSVSHWLGVGIISLVIFTTFVVVLAILVCPILVSIVALPTMVTDDDMVIWLAQFGGTLAAATVAWILVAMFFGLNGLQKAGLFAVLAVLLLGLPLVW